MGKQLKSLAFRYGLPLAAFGLIFVLAVVAERYLSFRLDVAFLIIALLISTAWFLGRAPGILIALLFETMLVYYSTAPYTFKSAVTTFNRLALFISIVLFASARRAAEKKLREQRELLEVTIASIGDAVIATDARGSINFINPTAENLTGWSVAEAAGKPLEEVFRIINEETRRTVENPFHKIIREKHVVGLANHTILINKTGTELPIEDSGAPIKDAKGEIVGTIIVFHDVTSRREDERERERLLASEQSARREAETAARLKDEFLATVSHELRTPLSAILGWASIIQKGNFEEKTVRQAVEIIVRNAKSQTDIINDILDVSRIITGKMKIDPELVEIAPLIQQTIENLRPAALAKSLQLTVSLDENGALIWGDADRLRQIIWNLISNAIKFTPENGRIDVSLKQIDARVELEVRDDGIGISEDALNFIFERFRQHDSSTTREHGGLGLGLAIVRHLVEIHGGTVEAESAGAGKGAIFTVRLPLANRTAETAGNGRTASSGSTREFWVSPPDLKGLRVLVVDDDADTLEILDFALNQYGADVRTALSSVGAFEVFLEWRPDILISDIAMPVEDGFTLIGKIRQLPPEKGGQVPAAALTAYASEKDRRKVIEAGFQLHIPKPVDPTTLAAQILELSGQN